MDQRTTPLLESHNQLKARTAGFGGWLMPIQYKGIIAEHNWCRTNAALFDICHMGEFRIKADPVKDGLEEILTINLSKMPLLSCRYGFMLNENGCIIDDVVIYKIKENEFMLVVNAATTENDFAHLKQNLKSSAELVDISSCTCKLDLQGPKSKDVLKSIGLKDIEKLKFYTFEKFGLLDEECIISRTGYTGELGYEIYISSKKVKKLWDLLLSKEEVEPAGLGARDTLRMEVGYPLYGQDIDKDHNPIEAGLDNFVDYSKDFKGKKALEEFKANNKYRKLTGFICQSRRAPRHNYKIYSEDKEIGIVTSGTFSPSLSCGIGLGYIENEFIDYDAGIKLKEANVQIEAKIAKKPFYKDGTARKKIDLINGGV